MFRNLLSTKSRRSIQRRLALLNAKRCLRMETLEQRRVFAGLLLNEISVNPPSTDTPFEYIEIK